MLRAWARRAAASKTKSRVARRILMQGHNNEDIVARHRRTHDSSAAAGRRGCDHALQLPGMIPLWFMPYALATGNCFILKPSEKVSMTSQL
ncbi:MAG: aldehyde dehydrogenase family protein [Caldilineaceae bacterium]